MKKSTLVKIVFVMIISLMILLNMGQVKAANNISFTDLTNTLDSENQTQRNNTTGGNNSTSNNTTGNNTSRNNTTNNTTNNVMRTNNTSNYNNSSLPKTGIEDSIPGVILVVVFGISAVYAYKKIQDYRNI